MYVLKDKMWGQTSDKCENNCQCSGLITDSFRINSGNNATKRRHEEALKTNFKFKMSPHPLNLDNSPKTTPRKVLGEIQISPLAQVLKRSPLIDQSTVNIRTPVSKRSSCKINRIFEERTKFKMENKENYGEDSLSPVNRMKRSRMVDDWTGIELSPTLNTPSKHEETSRDSGYSNSARKFPTFDEQTMDFTAFPSTSFGVPDELQVPNPMMDQVEELETLHDLEAEFESDNFDQCTNYEIVSTDSPDIISRGRSDRKINCKNFNFGAPIADVEASTSFNINKNARMLNFDETSFEFASPQRPKTTASVKKSLKFSTNFESPPKLSRNSSASSIGTMSSKLFQSSSTNSMESGFISEADDILDYEEVSNSPKVPNFTDLLSGQIKTDIIGDRPVLGRSISIDSRTKAKSLFSTIFESPAEKRTFEDLRTDSEVKRRRNDEHKRPVLQRAFSETAATIMSAVARSASNPDLIGDFSLPFALPLTRGQHTDLKCITSDTLAALMKGTYDDAITDYQVIDCRYPYEYQGGHIKGSKNMYTPDHMLDLMTKPQAQQSGRSVLVFHCEFSLERGPKLSRFLRSSDRAKNKENYPSLNYPEVYLLHEGYKTFYQNYPELCEPTGYTPMLDPTHKRDLQMFRSQSGTVSMKKAHSMDDRKTLMRQKSRSRLLL